MRDQMREKLNTEITRKQFLQYLSGAVLAVFGLNNLISLLTGGHIGQLPHAPNAADGRHGFGSSKFGM